MNINPDPSCVKGDQMSWVNLEDFAELLVQSQCPHDHASYKGSMHFNVGNVRDNITEACDDLGANIDHHTIGDFIKY